MRRRFLLLPIVLCAVAIPLFLTGGKRPPAARDFDATIWEDHLSVHDGGRQGMAAQLIAEGTLIGKTRAEVVAMLGEPPWRLPDWDMAYWLGPDRRILRTDSVWFIIRLGPDGRVAECRMVRD